MKQPIQLWLPLLDPAVTKPTTERDLQRAQLAWNGEMTVWLCPDLKEERRWEAPHTPKNPNVRELAIHSEGTNRIDVFHLTKTLHGIHLLGIHHEPRFHQPPGSGLLLDWLSIGNGNDANHVRLSLGPKKITLARPIFDEQGQRYFEMDFEPTPLGTFPLDHDDHSLEFAWPPTDSLLPRLSVAPNAESQALYGDLYMDAISDSEGTLPIFTNDQEPGVRSIPFMDHWPGQFGSLFPHGGGLDAMLAQRQMAAVALLSRTDLDAAVRKAENLSGRFISSARSPSLNAWFLPLVAKKGMRAALFDLEGRYGLQIANEEELAQSKKFQELMQEPVPVTRCNGALGLFWAFLLLVLNERRMFMTCERCGRVMTGPQRKRFCGQLENPQCWRARRARSKRTERARKRVKKKRRRK